MSIETHHGCNGSEKCSSENGNDLEALESLEAVACVRVGMQTQYKTHAVPVMAALSLPLPHDTISVSESLDRLCPPAPGNTMSVARGVFT